MCVFIVSQRIHKSPGRDSTAASLLQVSEERDMRKYESSVFRPAGSRCTSAQHYVREGGVALEDLVRVQSCLVKLNLRKRRNGKQVR